MSIVVSKQLTRDEIAALLDSGMTKKEAAKSLDISVATLSKIYGAKPRRKWTEEEINSILANFEAGVDINDLAKKYDTNPNNMRQFIYRKVGSTAKSNSTKTATPEVVEVNPDLDISEVIPEPEVAEVSPDLDIPKVIPEPEPEKESTNIPGTASAYLKKEDVDILDGAFNSYKVDYDAKTVYLDAGSRYVFLSTFEHLSLTCRELMAIAQVINERGRCEKV